MLAVGLVLLLWAALQLVRSGLESRLLSRLGSRSTRLALHPASLEVSTTALNEIPQQLLRVLPRIGRTAPCHAPAKGRRRRLGMFYDVGALVVLLGAAVAQVVLLVAALRALSALAATVAAQRGDASTPGSHLVRRAVIETGSSAPTTATTKSLLLRPLIPGITTPLSFVPTLLVALFGAQVFHELGHALAAACEDVQLESVHLRLYLLLLPTLAVTLPAASPSSSSSSSGGVSSSAFTQLRIISAGIWHNVILALGALALSQQGGAGSQSLGTALGVWRPLAEGVVVVSVEPSSPLAAHVRPGMLITHLDDLELDASAHGVSSPLDLWRTKLGRGRGDREVEDPYEQLGWCVDLEGAGFREVGGADGDETCCADSGRDRGRGEADKAPGVCFTARAPLTGATAAPHVQACLDPLALVASAPGSAAARCVDAQSCEGGPAAVCARISPRERVLRIGVTDNVDASLRDSRRSRTVVYQGDRVAVARQVSVTDLIPGYWLVPRGLHQVLEALWSALFHLSLALAFLNALPLPHLDGAHLVEAALSALGAHDELPRVRTQGQDRADRSEEEGVLASALDTASRWRIVKAVVRRRESFQALEYTLPPFGAALIPLGPFSKSQTFLPPASSPIVQLAGILMGDHSPPAPGALEKLITQHRQLLGDLYAALAPTPQPLVDADLADLEATLSAALDAQRQVAETKVAEAEARLAAGWARVHDWQTALGEPLRPAKRRGDGPLLSLVEEVDRIREGMKGRMEERGTRILALQARLRNLAEVVGREWLEVELEEAAEAGNWEDLDLTLGRMGALERECMRCEAEIAHRRELLTASANEIFALRSELGIHGSSSSSSESADPLADPLDEDILWHLGVGDARQPKREMLPTMENVKRVQAKRKWLEDEKDSRNITIQSTYDKLYPLWTLLGVSEDEMEEFVNRHMGSTLDVVNAYQDELARMLKLKRTNLSAFIARERETLTALWDALYVAHAQRVAQFPAYAISVEPTRVWNAAHGYEEEVVSDNVSEELLVAHERERERLEAEVEELRPVLDRLAKYFEVVEKTKELEAAAADPSRLMDKSRGAAARLAQEARDRKRVDRERPKLEAELRVLIPQWEAANGRPFLINGVGFIQGLDEQIRAEEQEKENRKRAKMGGTSSASATARSLRPHQTGATTMAPLKRQMTGASAKSAASAASATGPPAAKRLAAGSCAPTPSASRIGRPKSALGEANGLLHSVASTPMAPLRAQPTGESRARSGTVGAGRGPVAQTPLSSSTASSVGAGLSGSVGPQGMRIPAGWGGGGGGMSPSLGASAAVADRLAASQLVPQTAGFRPRG